MPDVLLQPLKRVRYLNTVRSFWSPEADVMVALIEGGDYVLDIGAYVGWYTRVLSEAVGPNGLVHSFEPIPDTFRLLSFCVRRLRLRNVTLFNCAASRINAKAVMKVPRYPLALIFPDSDLSKDLLPLQFHVPAVIPDNGHKEINDDDRYNQRHEQGDIQELMFHYKDISIYGLIP